MFPAWRLQLHEAKLAYQGGRLEDARRLIEQNDLGEFLPGQQLSARVARSIAERAEQRAAIGQSEGGWRDLRAAASLGGAEGQVDTVRREFVTRALSEAERLVMAGDPQQALACLDRLARHDAEQATTRAGVT
ncbi:MAG: hypothetical protein IH868_00020 [Chloroflexi bacterium]|nr:hypothetical protein [Chloroflexota bacterium]